MKNDSHAELVIRHSELVIRHSELVIRHSELVSESILKNRP